MGRSHWRGEKPRRTATRGQRRRQGPGHRDRAVSVHVSRMSACWPRRRAGHGKTELASLAPGGRTLENEATRIHDDDAVGELADLIEVLRNEQDGRSLAAMPIDEIVNEFSGGHIQSLCGGCDDERVRIRSELTAEEHLLNIPAGEIAAFLMRSASLDVELPDRRGS